MIAVLNVFIFIFNWVWVGRYFLFLFSTEFDIHAGDIIAVLNVVLIFVFCIFREWVNFTRLSLSSLNIFGSI